ncbi:MAG: PEGA domain-containing protein [Myxococcales bacterium]|nr:PEGA domain-containing protein [Myxococcales bacterium]
MRRLRWLAWLFCGAVVAAPAAFARAEGAMAAELSSAARERARNHYETGLGLFDAGDREQALVEFKMALDLFPSNDVVFMLAQCEYHLGRLKDARAHYETFVAHEPEGPLAEAARLRIAAIDRRPSTVVINTVPSDVAVTLEGAGQRVTGEAPNEFQVPRGTYKVTVSRANFQTQVRTVDVGIAETKPLFFKLDPVPGRLVVTTRPRRATLFVRGMRAENPYNQRLDPGVYEIYAEAEHHESRRESVEVRPGEDTRVSFGLDYVQRNGRTELIAFWGLAGALAAVGLVSDQVAPVGSAQDTNPASLSLLTAAAGVGAVTGGLIGARLTPRYIPDNQGMYRIGAMAVGTLEGVFGGLALSSDLSGALVGGALGLAAGAAFGIATDERAPTYGRVTLIQSSAAMGALAGALAVPALGLDHEDHLYLSMLLGLNVGVGVGLAGAYLPDQTKYGPSWQRMVLVDLTVAAGAFAGALVGAISECAQGASECQFQDTPTTTRRALAGGALGLVAGWLVTRSVDDPNRTANSAAAPSWLPHLAALPVQSREGRTTLVPSLSAQGRF